MDWEWTLLIGLITVCASGYLGYVLGLKAKRPTIVIDYIKVNDKETYIKLNNVGEGAALNVKVQDADTILEDEQFYKEMIGKKITFKFDKIKYIEPSKPQDAYAKLFMEDKMLSDSSRLIYSYGLRRFEFLIVTYTDNFGIRYQRKLTDLKIEH